MLTPDPSPMPQVRFSATLCADAPWASGSARAVPVEERGASWLGDGAFELRYACQRAGAFLMQLKVHGAGLSSGSPSPRPRTTPPQRNGILSAAAAVTPSGSPAAEWEAFGEDWPLVIAPAAAEEVEVEGAEAFRGKVLPAGSRVRLRFALRDRFGNRTAAAAAVERTSSPESDAGSDALTVMLHGGEGIRALPLRSRPHASSPGPTKATDVSSVRYEVEATLSVAGSYSVLLSFAGAALPSSPIPLNVEPATPCGSKSKLSPPPTALARQPCEFHIESFDRFGNRQTRGGATVAARTLGPASVECVVGDLGDGGYRLTLTATCSGEYRVVVSLDGHQVRAPHRVHPRRPFRSHFATPGPRLEEALAQPTYSASAPRHHRLPYHLSHTITITHLTTQHPILPHPSVTLSPPSPTPLITPLN